MAMTRSWQRAINYSARDDGPRKRTTTSARGNGPRNVIRENCSIAEVSRCARATAVAVLSCVLILIDVDTVYQA